MCWGSRGKQLTNACPNEHIYITIVVNDSLSGLELKLQGVLTPINSVNVLSAGYHFFLAIPLEYVNSKGFILQNKETLEHKIEGLNKLTKTWP